MQTPRYNSSDEMELMTRLWSPTIKDDPLAFVLLAFPWRERGTPLEHFDGPRRWQRTILADLRDHLKANQGRIDYETFRMAVASGRGIGGLSVTCDEGTDRTSRAAQLQSVNVVSGIGVFAMYVYGVYDGIQGYRRTTRERTLQPFVTSSPTSGLLGVAGTF